VALPVDEIRGDLMAEMAHQGARILLRAPTGSGKSTGVPLMLLEEGRVEGRILVVQPRRIAARMLAEYVSRLAGSRVGESVGYAVRFDSKYGNKTRVIYLTDGVLQRWLREDPELKGVGAVIFDEFHERRLSSDLVLARTLDLQEGVRPDLKLMVMSATLETGGLADYLRRGKQEGDWRVASLEAGGRMYPVEIEQRAEPPPRRGRGGQLESLPLWERVAEACRSEIGAMDMGTGVCAPRVLVFLPGTFEIRRTQELLERAGWAKGWEVKPLYSALSPERQWEAVGVGEVPRIVLATNVAETSITIDGIRVVIDTGVARMAEFDVARGVDTLMIRKISRASAEQRAGRAGRTGPGRCVRLWSGPDHAKRAAFEKPEIWRVDLAEAMLYLLAGGVTDVRAYRWLNAPEEPALARAEDLLSSLGAMEDGALAPLGESLAAFPLHPRSARLLMGALDEDCVAEACFAAAILQADGVFVRTATRAQREKFQEEEDLSDFEADWRACEMAERVRFEVSACRSHGVHGGQAREVLRVWKQLCGLAQRRGMAPGRVTFDSRREQLAKALLAAFGDHVGMRLGAGTLSSRVVGGRRGKMDEGSVARSAPLFLAAELTEVQGRETVVHLNHCVSLKRVWLEKEFPDELRREESARFDEQARRVIRSNRILYRDLVLEEKEGGEASVEEGARLLAERVLDGSLKLKKWDGAVEKWIMRVNFIAAARSDLEIPSIGASERAMLVEQVCFGGRSYKEIKEREVWPVLEEWLSAPQQAALESFAPKRIILTNGEEARVRYEEAGPVIGLKVQKLYGVEKTPEIGQLPVRVEILAPNQRPWQVTQDLESFWANGYAQMKKDLAGRYPKHQWI
jgi:ATP-dependent helicase HrpB